MSAGTYGNPSLDKGSRQMDSHLTGADDRHPMDPPSQTHYQLRRRFSQQQTEDRATEDSESSSDSPPSDSRSSEAPLSTSNTEVLTASADTQNQATALDKEMPFASQPQDDFVAATNVSSRAFVEEDYVGLDQGTDGMSMDESTDTHGVRSLQNSHSDLRYFKRSLGGSSVQLSAAQSEYARRLAEEEAAEHSGEDDATHEPDNDDFAAPIVVHKQIYPHNGQKFIPFEPSELADPAIPNGVIPGSRRWRFHASMTGEDERKATTKFATVLFKQGFAPEDFLITFPPGTGKERYIQVQFRKYEDYIRSAALTLSWNNRPVELAFSAAPLPKRVTVLKINNINLGSSALSTVQTIFEEISAFVTIHTIWRCDKEIPAGNERMILPGNTLLILAKYNKTPRGGYYGPEDLPGFIAIGSGVHALHFLGRNRRCGYCKLERRLPLNHTLDECTYRRCGHCGASGHVESLCPDQQRQYKKQRNIQLAE